MSGCSNAARSADEGSALVVALITVTLALTLAGALVLYGRARLTLVRREAHRVETDYAAEAAATTALATLAARPDWRPLEELVPARPEPGRSIQSTVSVRAYGLYLSVAASAAWEPAGSLSSRALLLSGRQTGEWLPAIAFGDTLSALTLAAGTSVRGTIRTGSRGVETAALNGSPFYGVLEGERDVAHASPLPPYDDQLARETLTRQRRYLDALPDSPGPELIPARRDHPAWNEERVFDPDASVYEIGPGARIGPALSDGAQSATLILASGDLSIDGPLHLRPWTTLFVRGHVTLSGDVTAEHVLIVADRVTVRGSARIQGQVLARRSLNARDGARFLYPSVLYGPTDPFGESDALALGRAEIDGIVLVPPGTDNPDLVRLTLAPEAVVRGLVYSARTADVQGRIEGTLAVQRTRFYESPATYVNWLRGLVVDREARPDPLVLPFGFGSGPPAPLVLARRQWSWTGERPERAP